MLTKEAHDSCEFFLHQHHKSLEFPVESITQNDRIDSGDKRLSDIFTKSFVSPICYTAKIKDCLIGPRPEGISRYWPIFFGENYAYNFLNNLSKEACVKQGVFKWDSDDTIDFEKSSVEPLDFSGPCVWLYTFYNIDHLLRESLPSLVALEQIGLDFKKLKFIVPNLNGTSIFEMLVAFGIPAKNIVQVERQWMKFSEVYIPSFFSFGHLHTPSSFYPATGERVKKAARDAKVNTKRPKRIFVSRERAGMRRLINERYLQADFVKRGFDVVDPGSMSKLEQANYFSDAEIVVGQHGMGIANSIYAKPGCKIVEIMHTNLNRVSYFRTAQHLGGQHGVYYVEPLDLKYAQSGDKFGDVALDRTEFLTFLDKFL
jgi:hypothetical protein